MRSLELIHVRLIGQDADSLLQKIRESLRSDSSHTNRINLFKHSGIVSELMIHILHSNGIQDQVGLHLATALEEYGLVKRTIWEEV